MILSPDSFLTPMLALLAAVDLNCRVPEPPVITVTPVSQPISYDYSRSSEELTALMLLTEGRRAQKGKDMVSGGVRLDSPEISTQMSWSTREYPHPRLKKGCIYYKTIDVKLSLAPRILIAKEFNQGACGREVIAHEKRHVDVDRRVINKYAMEIGKAVQAVVNRAEDIGPYDLGNAEAFRIRSQQRIEQTIKAQSDRMLAELDMLQAQVDSPQEYARISAICKDVKLPGRK